MGEIVCRAQVTLNCSRAYSPILKETATCQAFTILEKKKKGGGG